MHRFASCSVVWSTDTAGHSSSFMDKTVFKQLWDVLAKNSSGASNFHSFGLPPAISASLRSVSLAFASFLQQAPITGLDDKGGTPIKVVNVERGCSLFPAPEQWPLTGVDFSTELLARVAILQSSYSEILLESQHVGFGNVQAVRERLAAVQPEWNLYAGASGLDDTRSEEPPVNVCVRWSPPAGTALLSIGKVVRILGKTGVLSEFGSVRLSGAL